MASTKGARRQGALSGPSRRTPLVVVQKGIIAGGPSQTAALTGRTSLEQQGWQRNVLEDAAAHAWLYRSHPWVRAIVDRTAQAAVGDAYHIEAAAGDADSPKGQTTDPGADASGSGEDARVAALRTVLDGIVVGGKPLSVLLKATYTDLLINGNAYWRVMRKGRTPVSVGRLDFRACVPNLDPKTGERTSYALYKVGSFSLTPETLALDDVIHFQDNEMGEGGVGLSRLEALDSSLSLDLSAVNVNLGYMRNGTKSGNVYSFADTMLDDGIERERQYLIDNFSKPEQSYAPLFLAGDLKLISEGAPGKKDMDFLKLREWTREEVASVYQYPLSLLSTAIVGALGSNGKEQDLIMFREQQVAPLQELVFLVINHRLLRDILKQRALTLVKPQQTALRLELVQIADAMIQAGATGNQALRVMGLPDVEGMDVPLFMRGRTAAMIGVPGDPDSAVFTNQGLVSGSIQDAAALASAGAATPTDVTEPEGQQPAEEVPDRVKKANSAVVFLPKRRMEN